MKDTKGLSFPTEVFVPEKEFPELFQKLQDASQEFLGPGNTTFHQAVYNKVWWQLFHCQNDSETMSKLLTVELSHLEYTYNQISSKLVDAHNAFLAKGVSEAKAAMFVNDIRRAYVVANFVKLMCPNVTQHQLKMRLDELVHNVKHLNTMKDHTFYCAVCDIGHLLTLVFGAVMSLENENRAQLRSVKMQSPPSVACIFRELSIRSMLNALYGKIEALNVFESVNTMVQPFGDQQREELRLFVDQLAFKNQELILMLPAVGKLLRGKR